MTGKQNRSVRTIHRLAAIVLTAVLLNGCDSITRDDQESAAMPKSDVQANTDLLAKYKLVRLTADLSHLNNDQKKLLPLLMKAADAMDDMFWLQAYGSKAELLSSISDPALRRFAEINYGPWDRLDDNAPFIEGVGPKPLGARFYPGDMTRDEFERAAVNNEALRNLYTVVRRDASGALQAIPFSGEYGAQLSKAAEYLREAAELAEDKEFGSYLRLRADALESDDYYESDMAWMDMKDNEIDVVIGPIEVYEDELFGYKAGAEAYVLLKDVEWSRRLAAYARLLPALQRGIPVDPEYKAEEPGTDSDLNAYDVIYYAGHANAGSKTIAINLPNDERVQAAKGSRRLQLKNAMRAKFDEIMVPISNELIANDQQDHLTFDAFFENTMLHEVAHGLGLKNTITNDPTTVRNALQEYYSAIEEGKADILGLYMVSALKEMGELDVDLMDNYTTFLAGIFRSVRFGASSAHGKANMIRFNFFKEMGAFSRSDDGRYRVEFDKMQAATDSLSARLLMLQGDGDKAAVADFVEQYALIDPLLQSDLDRLADAGIPVDIVFEQGMNVLN